MDEVIEELLKKLQAAEVTFARAYLEARGRQSSPGHNLSVDDARANAVLFMDAHALELPEVIRYRLHALLGIERSVEPS